MKQFTLGRAYRPRKKYADKLGNVILNLQVVSSVTEGFIVTGVDANGGVVKIVTLESGTILSSETAFLVPYDRYLFKRKKL